jgi:hypothetical protein
MDCRAPALDPHYRQLGMEFDKERPSRCPLALRSLYFLREDTPVLGGRAVKMDRESSPLQTPYPHRDQRLTQVDGGCTLSAKPHAATEAVNPPRT